MTGSAGTAPQGFAALILAGSRGPGDPVAAAEGVSHKCLVELAGRPMILHVIETLAANSLIGPVAISIEDPALLQASAPLAAAIAQHGIQVLPSDRTPSRSVQAAVAALRQPFPLLVTTADNPLLNDAMIGHFAAEVSRTKPDLAVGLAPEAVIRAALPDAKRTYLPFRDGRFSGCNLFALMNPRAMAAVAFWTRAERHRKQPWRLVFSFGPVALLLFLLRRLSLDAALARASRSLGCTARAVAMPFAYAAVDVDKVADLALVRRILSSEQASG